MATFIVSPGQSLPSCAFQLADSRGDFSNGQARARPAKPGWLASVEPRAEAKEWRRSERAALAPRAQGEMCKDSGGKQRDLGAKYFRVRCWRAPLVGAHSGWLAALRLPSGDAFAHLGLGTVGGGEPS